MKMGMVKSMGTKIPKYGKYGQHGPKSSKMKGGQKHMSVGGMHFTKVKGY